MADFPIPDGWMLVPKEPTEAMIRAMHDGPLMADDHDLDPDNSKWIADCYRAMLSASPLPQVSPSLGEAVIDEAMIERAARALAPSAFHVDPPHAKDSSTKEAQRESARSNAQEALSAALSIKQGDGN